MLLLRPPDNPLSWSESNKGCRAWDGKRMKGRETDTTREMSNKLNLLIGNPAELSVGTGRGDGHRYGTFNLKPCRPFHF